MRIQFIVFTILIFLVLQGCSRTALLSSANQNIQNETNKERLIPNFSIEGNADLTDIDIILANGALRNVLNNNGPKIIESWRNPLTGHFGEIIPSTHFWVNQTFCLNYFHNYVVNDLEVSQQGVACKKVDGKWVDYS